MQWNPLLSNAPNWRGQKFGRHNQDLWIDFKQYSDEEHIWYIKHLVIIIISLEYRSQVVVTFFGI